MRRVLLCTVALGLYFLAAALPATGDSFSFTGGQNGGTIWFSPAPGATFSLFDTSIDQVSRTSLGPSFDLIQGLLSFETGPQTSCTGDCVGDLGDLLTINFGPGGDFRLTGGFDNSSGISIDDTDTSLIRATFLSGVASLFLPPDDSTGTGSFAGILAITFIHPDLLEALGFPRNFLEGDGTVRNVFADLVWDTEHGFMIDANVILTDGEITPVPEGGTLFLMGAGLLVAVFFLRRILFDRSQG